MSFERWTNNNEPEEFEVRSWIDDEKSLRRFFNRDGTPKVDRNADGSFSVGLSRFHKQGTIEEADGFRVEYGYLPDEAKNAIREWNRREVVDSFLKSENGRPAGSATRYKFPSREGFIKTIHDAKIQIEKAGEYPSQERVAELLEFEGSRAIQRLCRRFTVKYKNI